MRDCRLNKRNLSRKWLIHLSREVDILHLRIKVGWNLVLSRNHSKPFKGPKMPCFEQSKDNMDAFLHRFEIYAETQCWRRDQWAVYLSALLKGKALEVYSRLPVKDAQDYEVLKDALLKRFNLTEESFKQKFKTAKPELNEAPGQFLARLESYLMRWIELAEVVQDFDGLKNLTVKEQFLESCSVALAVFLRERKPTYLGELAEQYSEAHSNSKTAVKKPEKEGFSSSSAFPHKKPETQSFCRTSQCKKTCFTCGKLGHNKKKLAEMEQRYSSRGGMPMNTHEC